MTARVAGDAMHFTPFATLPASLPEAWRDLDMSVWRWVSAHGGDALLAETAAWASHADGDGHSALRLDMPQEGRKRSWTDDEVTMLAASPMVATAEQASDPAFPRRPFVLDGHHFYLTRNFSAELDVAHALRRRRERANAPHKHVDDADLRSLFNGSWTEAEARQRDAVRSAPGKRMFVLTGGPGTGKTTTVLRMLLTLSREHKVATGLFPQIRIAAPTGKAAQRLNESLRQGAAQLRSGSTSFDAIWNHYLDNVLEADPSTMHRLLGSRGRYGGYAFNAIERLPADIVVVDEASMLDLGLLRALLTALRDEAVVVFVGDADQLTSVGTGSVLMDIVQALEREARGDLVRLRHCFRADTTLVPINEAVRVGDAEGFRKAWLAAEARTAAQAFDVPDSRCLKSRVTEWARRLQQAFSELDIATPVLADDRHAFEARLSGLRRQQLLCALREGAFGAVSIAADISLHLRGWKVLAAWSDGAWYPGRCVIVTRNDHAAGLYNGDVGVCLPVVGGAGRVRLQVAFDPSAGEAQAGQTVRLFDPNTLPPHEDAFALTIHKSQGSEYDHVAVVLPPDSESRILTRQTLYTGLSRARRSIELWSTTASTSKAMSTRMLRHSRLEQRMTVSGAGC